MTNTSRILKADEELQIAWGVVYMPEIKDSHGDFMTAEEIRAMAYRWMAQGDPEAVDLNHDQKNSGARIVESFIVRDGDPDFPVPGSWVVGVHVPDVMLWKAIKDGVYNGFSMEALVTHGPSELLVPDFPAVIVGKTFPGPDGHVHTFMARYDADGVFKGGRAYAADGTDGHTHTIKKAVVSEETDGHAHRFALVEHVFTGATLSELEAA